MLVVFGMLPAMIQAGSSVSLYLSPASGTYNVDSVFSVKVKVDSGVTAINAAEGILTFNPNELQVISLSKNGSIFSLWTTEPAFSNSAGNIVFGGGTPSNFTGTSGTIITITFKTKASALSQVTFSSGSVLAGDGKGTNILGSMNNGVYAIKSEIVTPPTDEEYMPPPTIGVPVAPIVSSPTHSDPNKWYSNNDPEFLWKVPVDVSEVKLLIDYQPVSTPTILYTSQISEKKVRDLADGAWYFHVRFKNQYGWGEILHRKVLIDTNPPKSFEIKIDDSGDTTNPSPVLYFKTTDSVSGVEYYKMTIDEDKPVMTTATITKADLKEPYQIAPQTPGRHLIKIKIYDMAGNFSSASTEIEILPIESPVITKFPMSLTPGQTLNLEGKSLPGVIVRIFIQETIKEAVVSEVKANEKGEWSFVSLALEKGDYEVWTEVRDKRGALSLPSQRISFWVGLYPFLRFGKIAIDYLSIMITLVILIAVLIGIIFYTWYRISLWRRRLRRETKEVTRSVTMAFRILQEKIQEQIEYLDKKPGLTKKEKEVRNKLQEALNISKESIRKEIKDIEKELE
ncbi:MAG: hypothetical protein IB617_01930 [Candidatus Nealsonbacteria bacterium]|nr:MAG: hypothetical protein IB617_01930 [Candidatus Nealsonbacteria bacterium]